MSVASRIRSIAHGALRRNRMESEMEAELRFHMASYADDLIRGGVAREEAERRALLEFGHVQPLKEECRDARGLRWWDETTQDLRYAGRMLRKYPAFASIVILTLALGIGANTAIFSIVDAWVLRPLPYANSDRLVAILSADRKRGWQGAVAPADLYDWRADQSAFEFICGWTNPFFTLQSGDLPERVLGARVNGEFFQMLGVTPQLGRVFLPQEDEPDAAPVAILSDAFWRNRFAADPALVGRTIPLDGQRVTVVGVLPRSFHLPLMGDAELWMPLALSRQARQSRQMRYLQVIARFKSGFDLKRATGRLAAVAQRLEHEYPESNTNRAVVVRSLADEIGREGGNQEALIMFWLVACVLLIACGNVANLIVNRALVRQKEMAVRLAIGSGRGRLLRQLLTENLLLFLAAAVISVAFANWGLHWIAGAIPATIRAYLPNRGALRIDMPALLYTLGIGLGSGILFGFAPAFHCWRIDVNHALKESASRLSAGNAGARLKNCLVIFEVALSLVVLVASGLLIKGVMKVNRGDPGFRAGGLLAAGVILSDPQYEDLQRAHNFFEQLRQKLAAIPGVTAVGGASDLPFSGDTSTAFYTIDGQPVPPPAERPFALLGSVMPGYLDALGISLVRGRDFSDADRQGAAPVAIINQTMAQHHWPDADPIGRRIRYGATLVRTATIVGVVKDTRGYQTGDPRTPQIMLPDAQFPHRSMWLAIRTASPVSDLGSQVRRAVASVDKAQAVSDVRTMESMMQERQVQYTVVGQVTMFFAGLALFLAALGIYGVVAYSVATRSREFGIRMALGAGRRDLHALVVSQGLRLAAIGLLIGLAGAFTITHFMAAVLYQVSPTDAPTFIAISVLLLGVAAFACYLPARRASGVEPTRALRYE